LWRLAGTASILAAATVLRCVPAAAEARAPLFAADQEACFGRVYDQPHLARHPNQKVTGIHIFRSLGERLVSRFRSSQELAAHSHANFGIKGTLATL
jgi:hypothetical protein